MDEFIEGMIYISIAGAILFVSCMGLFAAFHVSDRPGTGQQIGYVAEVENSGLVWRPDEIVLIGSEATFSDAQTSWEYASASPEITDAARHYLKTHEKVIVEYETVMIAYGWEYSHTTRITNISKAGE